MRLASLMPVMRTLNLLPWIGAALGLLLIFVLFMFSSGAKDSTHAAKDVAAAEGELVKQLQDVKQKTESLQASVKEKLGLADVGPASAPVAKKTADAPKTYFWPGASDVNGGGFAPVNKGSEPYIPAGSVIQAQLIMPIRTSLQASFVMAQTTNEFRYNGDSVRRVPKGSRLIGSAILDPMLRAVTVRFHTLVSPKGLEYPASLLALSAELFPSLEGFYFSNDVETYGAVLAMGFMSGFADAARDREITPFYSYPKNNVSNQVLSGVSSASFRVAEEIIQDVRNRRVEYITVPAGQKVFLVFDQKFVVKNGQGLE